MSGLGKAFTSAQSAASAAGDKIKGAIGGVLSTLNSTGILGPFQGAIDGAMGALDKLSEHGTSTSTKLMGAGGIMAGVGLGLQAVASKEQASHQQLQAAVEATGKDYEDYGGKVDAAIKHQENFGHSADETQNALRILTQATGDPAKALEYLNTATDLAAAKHESLDTAATQLGKTYNGSAKLMKEFGATAEKSVDTTAKVEAATKAATSADEASDKAKEKLAVVMDSLKGKTTLSAAETVKLHDAQKNVTDSAAKAKDAHDKLADTQSIVVNKTEAAGDNMDILAGKLKGLASAAADTFTGKLDALKAKVERLRRCLRPKVRPGAHRRRYGHDRARRRVAACYRDQGGAHRRHRRRDGGR